MKIAVVLLQIFLLGIACAQEAPGRVPEAGLSDKNLLARLRSGGLVLLFRHGETTPNPDQDHALRGLSQYPGSDIEKQKAYLACDRQRVLSEEGRQDMVRVRRSMQKIGVLIGEVLASPMCRTRESAWLLAGKVAPAESLLGPDNDERQRLITTNPEHGLNRIVVSHHYVVAGAFGDFDQQAGHEFAPRGYAFVLDPDNQGGFKLLARLGPTDWERLALLADE